MDNQRLILFAALSIVILLLYNAWQDQYGAQAPVVDSSATESSRPGAETAPAMPSETPAESAAVPAPDAPLSNAGAAVTRGQRVHVHTDLLDIEIDTTGGDIRRAALPAYSVNLKQPAVPVQLMNDTLPDFYIAQSGLLSSSGAAPDHHAVLSVEQTDFQLRDGQDEIKVPFTWRSADGITVVKTYTFHRNSYVIDLDVRVENASAQDWTGRFYRQLQRTEVAEKNQSRFIYTYMGGVVSTEENRYEKVKFDEMAEWKPEQSFSKGGWVAMLQHYFIGAWIPDQDELNHVYSRALDGGRYLLGLSTAERALSAGATTHFTSRLYIGPKEQDRLEHIAPHLRLTVDYGVLDIIAKPLFWLLEKIHDGVHNWGVAIILVTLLIKLVFYKLSETSYRSMANMRRLQPKLMALKERFGDDRQRMSQEMMRIYKEEKINPLGGCLPIVVQIPVFIALYWVLLESVELRHAAFIPHWIDDLSSKDPFYVLPILMGISMFIQQKLNPAPMDPMQAKVLKLLPFIFTLFFAFFPSGLVLYWVVNNILSIAQQWVITRRIEGAAKPQT